MKTVLCDPRAEAVLARLDEQGRQQSAEMRRYYDAKRQSARRTTDPSSKSDMDFVRDKLVALDPEKCDLCYMLCRAIGARRVVEFGTSFGVSTLYMDVMAPQLRPGAIVLCDNVEIYEREYSDYTSFVRDPKNGFRSVLFSHQGGLEISVKLG
jgi:predicted O-methyltransferase YrrM